MSAEALYATFRYSKERGPELKVQMAIAAISERRHGALIRARAKQDDIADLARVSRRRVKGIIAGMLKKGSLMIYARGKGQTPHTYELPTMAREVSKADSQEVSGMTPVIREKPYTETSHADCTKAEGETSVLPSEPTNVVPMYPAKRRACRRKGHG